MDRYTYRSSRKQKPSFSSTLLDVIYQSVDEPEDEHTKTIRNRQSIEGSKNIHDAVFLATGFETSSRYCSEFSSSEADRIYGFPTRLKPLRTSINEDGELNTNTSMCQKQLHEPKAKSKAMKIYRYIKKGTHPVSPGGRLARFLTSLFSTTTNTNKKSMSGDDEIDHADRKSKLTVDVSTPCSFSRTCLNPTRSSVTTRNARFYPASMNNNNNNITDDDEYSQRRGHKSVNGDRSDSIKKEVNMHVKDKTRHVEDLLKNYQKKVEFVFDSIKNNDDEVDDETASYASSDLFELDHLSTIGIDPCMQELPLYETTSVDANRAIANGLSPLVL